MQGPPPVLSLSTAGREKRARDFDFALETIHVKGRYSAVSSIVFSYIGPENITTRHVAWDFRNRSWIETNFSETVTAIRVQTKANARWIDGEHIRDVQWYKARNNSALLRLNQYQAEANLYMDHKDSYYHDDRVQACTVVTETVELKFECNPGEGYNQGRCEECEEGKFKKDFANTQCEPCPDGFGTISTGQKICQQCPAGRQLQGRVCELCPTGKYRPATFNNKQQCEDCAAGRYLDKMGSTSAQNCSLCAAENISLSPAHHPRHSVKTVPLGPTPVIHESCAQIARKTKRRWEREVSLKKTACAKRATRPQPRAPATAALQGNTAGATASAPTATRAPINLQWQAQRASSVDLKIIAPVEHHPVPHVHEILKAGIKTTQRPATAHASPVSPELTTTKMAANHAKQASTKQCLAQRPANHVLLAVSKTKAPAQPANPANRTIGRTSTLFSARGAWQKTPWWL